MHKLVLTSDGSHTIYVPELDEHYHSIHGAVQESDFIFIKNGFNASRANPVHIFEVGFGTGLNALLTAANSLKNNREVFYTSIEKYPLANSVINTLNHHLYSGSDKTIFDKIHSAVWNEMSDICINFHFTKISSDIITYSLTGNYDLIYFDAFGPDKQPEMWSRDVFERLSAVTNRGGILVTYSAKGEVKRCLRSVGFQVSLLPGPPGKRHMIRAIKI